jgi:hypothetical protein
MNAQEQLEHEQDQAARQREINAKVRAVNVTSKLAVPHWRTRKETDDIPADLIGASIVSLGAPDPCEAFEGGGLIIDYRPAGSSVVKRLALEFNEGGMWILSQVDGTHAG